MKKASASIEICQSPADVFRTITRIETMDQWILGLSDPVREGEALAGKEMHFRALYGSSKKNTQQYRFRVYAWIPDRVFGFRSLAGPLPFKNWLVLHPTPRGTRITSNIVPIPNGKTAESIFRNFGSLIRYIIHRQQASQLRSLKRYVESQ